MRPMRMIDLCEIENTETMQKRVLIHVPHGVSTTFDDVVDEDASVYHLRVLPRAAEHWPPIGSPKL